MNNRLLSVLMCIASSLYAAGNATAGEVPAAAPEIRGGIFIQCAAGMRNPVTEMAAEFEKLHGVKVQLNFEGSNKLLSQLKLTRKGDVYVAGDADYIAMAAKEGLIKTNQAVCYFVPVILVKKGNPKGITSLSDMTRSGVKIAHGDEKAAAVGRIIAKLLELNGVERSAWDKNVVMTTPTVNELGVAIKLGTIDATVVWDAIAKDFKDVGDVVPLDLQKNVCPEVEVALLTGAENMTGAAAFIEFMTSKRGREILSKQGYLIDRPEAKK